MIQIEGHEMTIIATEINFVRPFTIDSLITINGERFDFVLNADKEPRDYWIRLKTLAPCRTPLETFAVLRYGKRHVKVTDTKVTFKKELPPRLSTDFPEVNVFNSPNPSVYPGVPLLALEAYESDRTIIDNPPDHRFFLFVDSPTILDDTMDKYGNYYRLSCKSCRNFARHHEN
jgi:Multicopper oxidase